jgi:amidophosphoribosyltransferase
MCGIVGLFRKHEDEAVPLGELFAPMLVCLTDRGPDSAGLAVYGDDAPDGAIKVTLRQTGDGVDWSALADDLGRTFKSDASIAINASYAVIKLTADESRLRSHLAAHHPSVRVMSVGRRIEILKEVGDPASIVDRFGVRGMRGSHMIGHTRMATESAVTTDGSHPFSTGMDLCLVHNGSLSNHNRLRRRLARYGIEFRTENDSEVAAGYLMWRLREGDTLEAALESALRDLDGFYTFAVGTADGFAVLRDPIACKPAVMAETDDYVAIASEYRALAGLPGIGDANVWEPAPAIVYTWGRN